MLFHRVVRVEKSRTETETWVAMKIGVGITVHNRFDVTDDTIYRWKSKLPKGAVLVVVDDASDVPYPQANYRFDENVGIARAKNKCLELLEDEGVTDFFLADNDCFPKHKSWWKPYVESSEAHLGYQFLDLQGHKKLRDLKQLYKDDQIVAYTGQRGCLLYYKKVALERVGGFDPVYSRALYEHSDLANRIHSAGLTSWRYADVVGSDKLWHSMDEYLQVERTIPPKEQAKLVKWNADRHNTRRDQGYQAFVPYRESPRGDRDVLITTLLTTNIDPQRGVKWPAEEAAISMWLESIERGEWEGVVLADELQGLSAAYIQSSVVPVESSTLNVYYQRWLHIYRYLRDRPEIRRVWCTDGSDVEVLRDPFEDMVPGKLYAGVEPTQVANEWMTLNHPATKFKDLFQRFGKMPLLNAGVVGGDRETVMSFAQKMVTLYADIESERFWNTDKTAGDLGDMAAFNYVAYVEFGNRLIYGPQITTEFRAHEDNGTAKFKHK